MIGATGLVGRALVNQLAEVGDINKIMTLTRRSAKHPCAKVDNHVVDFEKLQDHASLFSADYLFSCLGVTLKQVGSIEGQRKVDLDY